MSKGDFIPEGQKTPGAPWPPGIPTGPLVVLMLSPDAAQGIAATLSEHSTYPDIPRALRQYAFDLDQGSGTRPGWWWCAKAPMHPAWVAAVAPPWSAAAVRDLWLACQIDDIMQREGATAKAVEAIRALGVVIEDLSAVALRGIALTKWATDFRRKALAALPAPQPPHAPRTTTT